MNQSTHTPPTSGLQTLQEAALHTIYTVDHVTAPAHAPEWARWLAEIGFIAGEQVSVLARGAPGGDPLMVRAGSSTFALRKAEAACVQVRAFDPACVQVRAFDPVYVQVRAFDPVRLQAQANSVANSQETA